MRKKLQTPFSNRQYMLSKDFEIYYYDDAHLPEVKSHVHNYYEFYFFLQGDLTLFIEKQPFHLKHGDIILIPPGTKHHAVVHDDSVPYRRYIFWISDDFFHQLCKVSEDYKYIVNYALQHKKYVYHNDVVSFNSIQASIIHLLEEIHADRFGRFTRLALGVNELILALNRMAYEQNITLLSKKTLSLHENLLLYIESHLEEDLSLEHLSEIFYVSKYHISHIFKENMGFSVHQYITKKRLSMCCDALINGSSIVNTYLLYGFKDYSCFYRAFKKEYGLSPKEYRDQHSLPHIIQ